MNTHATPKPAWRELYKQGAVGLALLFLVPLLNLSEDLQKVAFLVIAVGFCGVMKMWISDNSAALEAETASLDEIHGTGRYYTLHPGIESDDPSDTLMDSDEKEAA